MYPEATRAAVGGGNVQWTDGGCAVGRYVDFAIRRRIPRVLSSARSQLVFDGLMHGLGDRRFEVRYQCGRAMAAMHDQVGWLEVNPRQVLESVEKELNVSKPVWEGQRLLDGAEDSDLSPLMDEFLRNRSSRSLEHVFTLLMLTLPKEPLRVAFRGLHTDDGIAGDGAGYLESTMPEDVREAAAAGHECGSRRRSRRRGRRRCWRN
jgi:hypothetical protein